MRSTKRITPAVLTLACIATWALVAQGCTISTNTTAIQCTSQAECAALGPDFADTTCDKVTKTCVKVTTAPECSKNAECVTKLGPYSICRKSDKKCVSLLSDECPRVLGEPEQVISDDAIVLGAITPVASGELGDAIEKGLHLAQREISPSSTGTGIPSANGTRRPVVVVSCHEFNSDGFVGLLAAANHLVKNVQVPAMIGPIDPTDAELVATNVNLPNKVLSIFTASITSNLDSLPNPIAPTPIIWRLNYSDREAANAVQAFINGVLVPKLKTQGALADGEPLRVAIVSEGDYKGKQVGQVMTEKLTWNTKGDGTTPASCSDNLSLTPSACLLSDFGSLNDTIGNPVPEGKISAVLGQLLTNGGSGKPPHVVVHSYATFGIQRILFPLEASWDSVHSPTGPFGGWRHRPYHIGLFAPWNTFEPMFGFMDRQRSPSPLWVPLKERLFALYTAAKDAADPLQVTQYELRYKQAFPEFEKSGSPRDVLPRQLYDSLYMVAFALVANGDKPITGPNLAAALPRLLAGQDIQVGPEDFQKAVGILAAAGQGVNLKGLSGNLDLGATTGSPRYSLEISCPGVLPSGGSTNFVPSGYYFDEAAGQATGTFPGACPTLKDKW